jgi:hypothetical protein
MSEILAGPVKLGTESTNRSPSDVGDEISITEVGREGRGLVGIFRTGVYDLEAGMSPDIWPPPLALAALDKAVRRLEEDESFLEYGIDTISILLSSKSALVSDRSITSMFLECEESCTCVAADFWGVRGAESSCRDTALLLRLL